MARSSTAPTATSPPAYPGKSKPSDSPCAKESTAQKRLGKRLTALRLATHLSIHIAERQTSLVQGDDALAELSKLDGCYALRTDLTPAQANFRPDSRL